MRVLYVYCHPLPESFHGALRERAIQGLTAAGHEIDLCDLYAEKFDPVMWPQERREYHDLTRNQSLVADYVRRLKAAEGIVLQFPVWSFGPPAMMKGWLDRLMMPGVAFDISDPAHIKPALTNLRRIAGVTTYGRPRWRALAMSDPPRRIVKRYLRWMASRTARVDYHALYHMNVATPERRAAFMDKVAAAMTRF